jgi:hypothetical protein
MSWNVYLGPSGRTDTPIIEFGDVECIYNVVDGTKWRVISMEIANKNVDYYAKQGKVCTIETNVEVYGYQRVNHGPSGSEYNEQ